MNSTVGYRRGDWVEVKSLREILDTLDADGKLRGLIFMPEMAQYCGQRFRVYRRATKTCVEGLGVRRMENAVLLEGLRCDGMAHEGCQRGCLLFWKEAWLNPCTDAAPAGHGDGSELQRTEDSRDGCLANLPTKKGDCFCCQSTEMSGATRELPGGNLRHFFRDFLAAEVTLAELGRMLWQKVINRLRRRFGQGLYKYLAGSEVKPPGAISTSSRANGSKSRTPKRSPRSWTRRVRTGDSRLRRRCSTTAGNAFKWPLPSGRSSAKSRGERTGAR